MQTLMRPTRWLLALVLILALAGCIAPANAPANANTSTGADTSVDGGADEPIKIGLVSPFSGPIGFLGEWMANSAQVEVDMINENGGLLGRQVELITRDDEANPARSVEIVREFIDNEGVSMIIGPSFSSNAYAAKDLIEAAGVIGMFPTVGGMELLADDPTYLFRVQESTALSSLALWNLIEDSGYTKAAIFAPDDAFAKDFDERFTELSADSDVEYVGTELYREDDQDLTPYALRLKESGVDVVAMATGNSTFAARAATAIDSLDWDVQIIGISGLQGYTFAELAGEAVVGAIFEAAYLGYPAEVPFEEMPTRYAQHVQAVIDKYGAIEGASLRTYPGTALAGDAVWVWAQAVERAGTLDPDAVVAELEQTDVSADETPSGIALKITADSHESYREGSLYTYEWYQKDDGSFGYREVE